MLNSNRKPSQKYLKLPFHPANAGWHIDIRKQQHDRRATFQNG